MITTVSITSMQQGDDLQPYILYTPFLVSNHDTYINTYISTDDVSSHSSSLITCCLLIHLYGIMRDDEPRSSAFNCNTYIFSHLN